MILSQGKLFAILAGILWGISPIFVKRGLSYSTPLMALIFAEFVSVPLIFSLATLKGELTFSLLTLKAFLFFVGVGIVGQALGRTLYVKGIQKIGASKATSIKNSAPLITTILAIILLGETLTQGVAIGVIAIVGGILIITRIEKADERMLGQIKPQDFFFPILAAFCYSFNPILKKAGMNELETPLLASVISQSTALIIYCLYVFTNKRTGELSRISLKSAFYFGLGGASSSLASLLSFYAVITELAIVVSPLWRISPLITFIFGRFTLKGLEIIPLKDGFGALLIVFGIVILTVYK